MGEYLLAFATVRRCARASGATQWMGSKMMQDGHALSGAAAGRGLSIDQQMSDEALVGLIARGDKHAMQVLFSHES